MKTPGSDSAQAHRDLLSILTWDGFFFFFSVRLTREPASGRPIMGTKIQEFPNTWRCVSCNDALAFVCADGDDAQPCLALSFSPFSTSVAIKPFL